MAVCLVYGFQVYVQRSSSSSCSSCCGGPAALAAGDLGTLITASQLDEGEVAACCPVPTAVLVALITLDSSSTLASTSRCPYDLVCDRQAQKRAAHDITRYDYSWPPDKCLSIQRFLGRTNGKQVGIVLQDRSPVLRCKDRLHAQQHHVCPRGEGGGGADQTSKRRRIFSSASQPATDRCATRRLESSERIGHSSDVG